MRKLITTIALLALIDTSVAIAQTVGSPNRSAPPPSTSPDKQSLPEAPVGHRQPRADQVPSEKNANWVPRGTPLALGEPDRDQSSFPMRNSQYLATAANVCDRAVKCCVLAIDGIVRITHQVPPGCASGRKMRSIRVTNIRTARHEAGGR